MMDRIRTASELAKERTPGPDSSRLSGIHDPARWLEDHGDALFRFARSRVGRRGSAEDLVQETLLAAWRARDGYRGEASPRTWLIAILRRKIADHFRQFGSESRPHDESESDPDPITTRFFSEGHWNPGPGRWRTPPEVLENHELREVLEACRARLPASLGVPFALRDVDGQEPAEVARELGISPGTLRVRLHRARLLLRDCLERRWFSPPTGRRSEPL